MTNRDKKIRRMLIQLASHRYLFLVVVVGICSCLAGSSTGTAPSVSTRLPIGDLAIDTMQRPQRSDRQPQQADSQRRPNQRTDSRQEANQQDTEQRQQARQQRNAQAENEDSGDPELVSAEREAAALTFVRRHHPELQELLEYIKENDPREYNRAIRGLFRKSEQLASIRDRGDREGFRLELNLWKSDSRARLLAARIAMTDTEELRAELRQVLRNQNRLRMEITTRERDRLMERVERLDDQLQRYESAVDSMVERQMQVLLRATRETPRQSAEEKDDRQSERDDRSKN